MKVLVLTKRSISAIAFFLVVSIFATFLASQGIIVATSATEKKMPIYCVQTAEKKVALTFDAAWGDSDTDTLLSILQKYNAKATVFVVGDWVTKYPESVKKFYDAGHEIGNHSDTHPKMSSISRSKIIEELQSCNQKIEKVTGAAPTLMRPPSGDYNNNVITTTQELGMFPIQWDVDSLDWKKLGKDEMVSRVLSRTKEGSILLFHNDVPNTPGAVEEVLKQLTAKGYSFVTVSDLIYKDHYQLDPAGRQIPAQQKTDNSAARQSAEEL